MEIVFATKNNGKLAEIRDIMSPLCVVSMLEKGIEADVAEDGKTFSENAERKARVIADICGGIVLADDSGLEIDFLGGAPGVYSARYMGENTPYPVKLARILEMMEGVPEEKRGARFVCAIAAVLPGGVTLTKTASLEGRIAREALGAGGFGYDPVFYVPELEMTTAQMSKSRKNAISHRGKALRMMKEALIAAGCV